MTTSIFMHRRSDTTVAILHDNVSQNQHMKLMINHFLITKHGEDNWKKKSKWKGNIKEIFFCVYPTTGTNSEAESAWRALTVSNKIGLPNQNERAHTVRPIAACCLCGNQQQRSPGWNRISTVEKDIRRITVLRLHLWGCTAFRPAWKISSLLMPAVIRSWAVYLHGCAWTPRG